MWNNQLQSEYEALLAGGAIAPLESHFLIELIGADRHSFLHNFCTADIKKLEVGNCCEAFILNGKGKTLALVNVLAFEDVIWLVGADATNAKPLIEHLDRYIIREDVQLADLTNQTKMFFAPNVAFEKTVGLATGTPNTCRVEKPDAIVMRTAQLDIAGMGTWLACEQTASSSWDAAFQQQGIRITSPLALEPIRIEKGTPWSGSEANETNLPQELQRDDRAISFNKGCYLGQETVARLDALGRVNRILMIVRFDNDAIKAGDELQFDGKPVGNITSVSWSPAEKCLLGFAYLRRAQAKPGFKLEVNTDGIATVI